jgi:hypothetical protein
MPLEPSVTYLNDLNPAWPTGADPKSEGDDHTRRIKSALKASFPNIGGVMPVAHDQVASKNDIAQAQFQTVLPAQPGGTITYQLVTVGGSANWQPKTAIFDDSTKLAQAHATALSF